MDVWIVYVSLTVLLCVPLVTGSNENVLPISTKANVIQRLLKIVETEQFTETRPFGGLGKPAQIEGLYRSDIKVNTNGKCPWSLLRRLGTQPSTQNFVSGWVAILVLDSFRYANAPMPPRKTIERISKMYSSFHDRNFDYDNSIITFYPATYNEKAGRWLQINEEMATYFGLLDTIGISEEQVVKVLYGDNLPPDLGKLFNFENTIKRSNIPSDFDSSAINLNFGATLKTLRDHYPEAWDIWNKDNQNITSVLDASKKYAYRPFSKNIGDTYADTRAYYIQRGFYDKAWKEGRDLALFNTWLVSVPEIQAGYDKGVTSPWSSNNVDITVVVNILSALINAVSSGLLDPEIINNDPDLMLLIESSGDLAIYLIENNFEDRIDLALVYYMSLMEFYWFTGKCLMLMENAKFAGPVNVPVLQDFYNKLAPVLRGVTTRRIIDMAKYGQDGDVFYDDFLGNGDLSYYDKPIERHEDRLYTTSMAANSLLSYWTVYDENRGLLWVSDTPDDVKATIKGCANWLEENTLTGQYSATSNFFGRDTHNFETLPFWYPANVFEYVNGTKIPDFTYIPEDPIVIGVQGYIKPSVYDEMLKVKQFGVPVPQEFNGYNNDQGSLIFWSSEVLTYASVLMTLAMSEQLQNSTYSDDAM